VIFKISIFSLFKLSLDLLTTHLLSHTVISSNQYNFNNLIIAVPAAPNQFTTIFIFFNNEASFHCKGREFKRELFLTLKLLITPAKQTIAVQC
jgi:hypothetical protein